MMLLEQDMNHTDSQTQNTVDALKKWHEVNPFATGINWAQQLYWAKMTDENFMLFAFLHPGIAQQFRKV